MSGSVSLGKIKRKAIKENIHRPREIQSIVPPCDPVSGNERRGLFESVGLFGVLGLFVCRTGKAPKAIPELAVHLPFCADTCGSVDEDGSHCLRSGMLEHPMTAIVFYAAAYNTVGKL